MSTAAIWVGLALVVCVFNIAMNVADYAIQGKHLSSIIAFSTCVWIMFSYMVIFGYAKNPFL